MSRSRAVSWHSPIAQDTGLPAIRNDIRGNVVADRKVNVLEMRRAPTVRLSMSAHGARTIALHYVCWQTFTDAPGLRSGADDGLVCLTNSNLKPVPDHGVGLFDARERSCQCIGAREAHDAALLLM